MRRYDWWNDTYYWEELVVDEAACNMERLSSGAAPVLDSHNTWGIGSQMGVVDRAWLSNGEGHALIRLSGREELAGVIADIGAGIIRNISVGYTVQRYEIERAVNPGDLPIYRAVEWTPSEISFVTVPADPAAGTRSNQPATGPGDRPVAHRRRSTPCLSPPPAPPNRRSSRNPSTTPRLQ
ncbi:MAG: hypothetical protein ACWGHP_08820 [Stenotrophomonas sp.]